MEVGTIKDKLRQIAVRQGCQLEIVKGKFNLSPFIRNLDCEKFIFLIVEEDFELRATCNMLAGTSDKPSFFSGNTSVQNRFSVMSLYKGGQQLPTFSVYENGLLGKLFKKQVLSINCKDEVFKNSLYNSEELVVMSQSVSNSAEVSPAINCKAEDDCMRLSIFFQSFLVEVELFEAMIQFAKRLSLEY